MSATRMSPLDASFLHIEDEVTHMHIGSVLILDGPAPRYEEVLETVGAKLPLIPRYRQVVRFVPLQLGRPVWVDDVHFNLEYHVRQTALPTPGGDVELRRLVGRVMSQQLDRTKPLWEIWVVEGLDEGRWAMVAKTHHAMVDGVSGSELLAVLLDPTPDPSRPAPEEWRPEAEPSAAGLATQAVADAVRSPYEQLRAVRASTRVPKQLLGQAGEVAKGLTSSAGILRPTPVTSLNGPIGPHRRWDWAETNVDEIKRIRKGLDGTFNDVILAGATAGFRALLQTRDEPLRTVRTLVPVSVRARDDKGMAVPDGTLDNQVSAMFAELPVAIEDPVDRLHAISAQMADLKEAKQAVAGEALTSLTGFAPPGLLAAGARLGAKLPQRVFNTVTTNVPGPQFPLYLLGRRMQKVFPFVPIGGQIRFGVAIFSYDGTVNYGVTGDYDTTADIDVLCRGITNGIRDLLDRSAG